MEVIERDSNPGNSAKKGEGEGEEKVNACIGVEEGQKCETYFEDDPTALFKAICGVGRDTICGRSSIISDTGTRTLICTHPKQQQTYINFNN